MHWMKWLRVIGVVLFIWILWKLDWKTVLGSLRTLRPGYLAGYVSCFTAMVFVRMIRLRLCVRRVGGTLSLAEAYFVTLEPAFLGAVTPGRIGELTRIAYLQKHGMNFESALALVGVERLVDLSILLAFGLGGILYVFLPAKARILGLAAIPCLLVVPYLFMLGFNRIAPVLKRICDSTLRKVPYIPEYRTQGVFPAVHQTVTATTSLMTFFGIGCIALNVTGIYALGQAFGFRPRDILVCFAYAISALLSLLPISPAGLGTREATYIYVMGRVGVTKEAALLFAFLEGAVLSPLVPAAMLLPVWLKRGLAKITGFAHD